MPRRNGDEDSFVEDLLLPLVERESAASEPGRRELPTFIDCMNGAENPTNLIVNQNKSISRLDLTPDGRRYLQAEEGYVLPTALAERALVALRSIHRAQDPTFENQVFRFPIRRLVEDYMYPERYDGVRAAGNIIKAVLEQLRRVAHTRVCTDGWYDRKKGCRVDMDASIIDYIEVVYAGDNNTPQQVEVAWGKKAWESLRARYIRPLNAKIYVAIDGGFDLRLFRWLDRQLAMKPRQKVNSIQTFARSKLSVHGKTIARGGRTASTYVAKKIKTSIGRLNGFGFPVRVEIDDSRPDFRLTFVRLESGPNEVVEVDDAGDLLRSFGEVVHGTKSSRRRVFPDADRILAESWLDQYGIEASGWMAAYAARRFKADVGKKPRTFRALAQYEDAASGAWERWNVERAGQKRLPIMEGSQDPLPTWDAYCSAVLERSSNPELDRAMSAEVMSALSKEIGSFWRGMGDATRAKMVESAVKDRKVEQLDLLSEEEYSKFTDASALEAELKRRHGVTLDDLKGGG